VVIQNADVDDFYYVVDPPELTAFDPTSVIFENVVHDYFAEVPLSADDFAGFSELAPDQIQRLEGLTEGKHLLVGFFVVPGEREFPVRVISLQAGGGLDERTYRIFSQPALVTARAGRGRISDYDPIPPRTVADLEEEAPVAEVAPVEEPAAVEEVAAVEEPAAAEELSAAEEPEAVAAAEAAPAAEEGFFRFQIDNRYEDWEAIPTFLSFPVDRDLPSFTREQYGGQFEVLPIAEARHWGTDGSAINEIKVVNDAAALYLYISTHSTLSSNLSVFMYFHTDQNVRRLGATNKYTLELVPERAEQPGLVVLWQKDGAPLIVGELASGSFFIEAKIDKDLLYDIGEARPRITFFDLTTSYFDRQELAYEEFYIASIPLASIPTEQTLY
jgi:hypothetical protein